MSDVLQGVRVLDLSDGPIGGIATMVMADFGADVIKVELPGGDRQRALPSAPLWLRGKRSIVLDLATARDRPHLDALVGHSDVVVSSMAADVAVARHCDHSRLLALNPRLVFGHVSGFGNRGPYAGYAQHEAVVAAKVGRMLQFQGVPGRTGPAYSALQVATHATAQATLAAVLSALIARDRDRVGQYFETSLLRGLLPYEMGGVFVPQLAEKRRAAGQPAEAELVIDPFTVMPTLNYHPLQTSDGRWLQMGNLLPHLFANFLRVVGLSEELAVRGLDHSPASWSEAAREEFRDLMLLRMQEKSADEWMTLFVADGGVAAHGYQSTQDALSDADMLRNGHSLQTGTGQQLGVLAALTTTPGRVGAAYPGVGEHTREVLAEIAMLARTEPAAQRATATDVPLASANPNSSNAPHRRRRPPPLRGITVIEAATIIAAPLGGSMLADLGARVIKIEPLQGDPFRTMGPGLGAARVNAGKEFIALDLKQPSAQRIAQQLIQGADLLIHNYRPGVPERLGIGYETLAARNPKLVYLAANGYGPAGPGALRPSTHPIPGAALGGALYQMGGAPDARSMALPELRETARRLTRANELNPDPNTSVVVCSAALLGLVARQRQGVGQRIFVDMFGANAYANFDDCLAYPGKRPRRLPDRECFGIDPLWHLYPCASGWVFFGVADAEEWRCARTALGGELRWLAELPVEGARFAGEGAVALLSGMFAQRAAGEWEAMLAPLGIGCVRVDEKLPSEFFLKDAHAKAQALLVPVGHPQWGEYLRHGTLQVFDGTPLTPGGMGPLGQHTDALLREIGVSAEEIVALRAASAVC